MLHAPSNKQHDHCRPASSAQMKVAAALSAVTFCSWHPVITMECVDRFVDRAIGANSAIRAIGDTTP
jgi:hypothetical protein